jgi:hypothetical protein
MVGSFTTMGMQGTKYPIRYLSKKTVKDGLNWDQSSH